jgi:hypothetical protein
MTLPISSRDGFTYLPCLDINPQTYRQEFLFIEIRFYAIIGVAARVTDAGSHKGVFGYRLKTIHF